MAKGSAVIDGLSVLVEVELDDLLAAFDFCELFFLFVNFLCFLVQIWELEESSRLLLLLLLSLDGAILSSSSSGSSFKLSFSLIK
jgi:hypothetical protein